MTTLLVLVVSLVRLVEAPASTGTDSPTPELSSSEIAQRRLAHARGPPEARPCALTAFIPQGTLFSPVQSSEDVVRVPTTEYLWTGPPSTAVGPSRGEHP